MREREREREGEREREREREREKERERDFICLINTYMLSHINKGRADLGPAHRARSPRLRNFFKLLLTLTA